MFLQCLLLGEGQKIKVLPENLGNCGRADSHGAVVPSAHGAMVGGINRR